MATQQKASKSQMQLLAARLIFGLICLLFGVVVILAFMPPAQAAEPRYDRESCSSTDPRCDVFAFQREVEARVARLDRPLAHPVQVSKFYSNPGESQRAFAKRVTRELEVWSRRNGFASCGWIATDGDRFGVVAMTVQRRASCSANQHPMEMELTPYLLTAKG